MPYKASSYPHPFAVYPNDKFISVVLTSFCRPHYIRRAIESIHQTADMPFELIVNDDGSYKEAKDELYAMSDKVSTIVFNNGVNMGLNEAANRCISLASSKYILYCTDDCWFTAPCLKDICNVLSKDYIGFLCVANDIGPLSPGSICKANGTRFSISNYLGGGISQAFRKDVWKEVGGWDLRSTSGQSDNVFLFKILKAGYWKAVIEGFARVKCANFEEEKTYVPTAGFMKGNDCSLPKIFGLDWNQQVYLNQMRRVACQVWVDGERTIPNRETFDDRPNPTAGLNDINYWFQYFQDVFGNHGTSHDYKDVNWDAASRHGQSKWKDQIFKDFSNA